VVGGVVVVTTSFSSASADDGEEVVWVGSFSSSAGPAGVEEKNPSSS